MSLADGSNSKAGGVAGAKRSSGSPRNGRRGGEVGGWGGHTFYGFVRSEINSSCIRMRAEIIGKEFTHSNLGLEMALAAMWRIDRISGSRNWSISQGNQYTL